MKSRTVLKLLFGLSVVSIGCLPFFSHDLCQQKIISKYFKLNDHLQSSAKIITDSAIPVNEPIKLIENQPLQVALQLLRSMSFSQCRLVSSDHNGWVVDYKVDGHGPLPYIESIKDFDLLNRQTTIILDDQLITLCPIRIRSSNGPPII